MTLTEPQARAIACDWHSGQWSPLYAFCSSGTITNPDDLIAEIAECDPNPDERERLDALERYIHTKSPEPDDAP